MRTWLQASAANLLCHVNWKQMLVKYTQDVGCRVCVAAAAVLVDACMTTDVYIAFLPLPTYYKLVLRAALV